MDKNKVMNAIIKHAFTQEFKWGENDCGCFTGNVLKELTGIDYVAEYRGAYKTEFGAHKRIVELGSKDIIEATSLALNKEVRSADKAVSGDVVTLYENGEHALGICLGEYGVFLTKEKGIARVSLDTCIHSWSIN